MSESHSAPFFALMWPETERGLHLRCVGPSIIPLCKYLHKETSLLPLAKKQRDHPRISVPYTAKDKRRRESRPTERRGRQKKDRLKEGEREGESGRTERQNE